MTGERQNWWRRQFIPLLMLVTFAAFVLASYSLAVAHEQGCKRNNAELAVLRDILDLARPTPRDFKALSPSSQRRITAFYTRAYARIDQGKC